MSEIEASAIELILGKKLIKYSLMVAPVIIAVSGIFFGSKGVYSSAYACVLVIINFVGATKFLSIGARISPVALMAAAVASLFFDLALLTVGTLPLVRAEWMDLKVYGGALIAAHLVAVGMMARNVTGKLAYSGMKPAKRSH